MVSTTQQARRADTPANTRHVMQTGHLASHLLQVLRSRAHKQLILPRSLVGQADQLAWLGFYKSGGMNPAISHWRLELRDGQEIHIQEQADHYQAHWDHVSLRRDPLGHGLLDAPGLTLGLVFLALAVFGKGVR